MTSTRTAVHPVGAARRRGVVSAVLAWYDGAARDLPWRAHGIGAWAVLVSEFMLQQTPVSRVRRPWALWLDRWPEPADLAAEPVSEAIRAWGRLGYPRRAMRLHSAAVAITERHGGRVPHDIAALRALPGVGEYTAAAVASFAYGRRAVVLDTNVRRVLARVELGVQYPGGEPATERAVAEALLPRAHARAARWAVASMELGALVCTSRSPACADCPLRSRCVWQRAGRPAWAGPPRRRQEYAGTDRQCRGALLAVLRSSDEPVPAGELAGAWDDAEQRTRALDSLVADGLARRRGGAYALPVWHRLDREIP